MYAEPPPPEKVQFLRSEGKTYTWIANRYGITVELAYQLAHASDRVVDVREAEELLQRTEHLGHS